jgi:hypothetical protein
MRNDKQRVPGVDQKQNPGLTEDEWRDPVATAPGSVTYRR